MRKTFSTSTPMRYRAIATDYDGTLATDGVVEPATLDALQRYREAGGKLLIVTGRLLDSLQQVFPQANSFDGVIAENGAVFYHPASDTLQPLAPPPPAAFVESLVAQGIGPIHQGHVIVSTWEPHGAAVQRTITDMGLACQIIFNRQVVVMVLPQGVTKATGLQAALDQFGLSAQDVAGVGDAENDLHLLQHCGLGVAVENALPSLKAIAQRVTTQAQGAGVAELADWLIHDRV